MSYPIGAWDIKTGYWYPNHLLKLSVKEQIEHNVKAGYKCKPAPSVVVFEG